MTTGRAWLLSLLLLAPLAQADWNAASLAGDWRLFPGAGIDARGDLSPSQAVTVKVPAGWSGQPALAATWQGWYHRRIAWPFAGDQTRDAALLLGRVDSVDVIVFNGVRVGATGDPVVNADAPAPVPHRYTIPAEAWREPGRGNDLWIYVERYTGAGGISAGPVLLGSPAVIEHTAKALVLPARVREAALFSGLFILLGVGLVLLLRDWETSIYGWYAGLIAGLLLALFLDSASAAALFDRGLAVSRLAWASYAVAPVCAAGFLRHALRPGPKSLVGLFWAATALYLAIVVASVFAPAAASHLAVAFVALLALTLLLGMTCAWRARPLDGARRVLVAGLLLLPAVAAVSLVLETLAVESAPALGRWLFAAALLVFAGSHAYYLVDRFLQLRERLRATLLRERRTEDRVRRRIARDLHDSVGQSLGAASLQLRSQAALEAQRRSRLEHAVSSAVADLRRIARDLDPATLDHRGLAGGLHDLAAMMSTPDTTVSVHGAETWQDRDPGEAMELFRISQEAVTNACIHGHPERVEVVLDARRRRPCLLVRDNGIGLESVEKKSGVGLRSMHDRAMAIGAVLTLRRTASGWTVLELRLPRVPLARMQAVS